MEYYSPIKNKEILPFASAWTDPEGIMLSEISQTEKGKYCIISLVCGIFKKKKTHRKKDQTGGYQKEGLREGGPEGRWSKGTSFQGPP